MDTRPPYGDNEPEDDGLSLSQSSDDSLDGAADAGDILQALGCVLSFQEGLYSLGVGSIAAGDGETVAGLSVPCLQFTVPPSADHDPVDILTAWNDQGAWLGSEGGTVVVRAPPGGGLVLATLYGAPAGTMLRPADFEIRRLDRPRVAAVSPRVVRAPEPEPEFEPIVTSSPPPAVRMPKTDPAEVDIEVSLHVQRLGDCTFGGSMWCGNIGQKMQIEAFGIRPLERIGEADIECKAFGPGGRETRWVNDGKLSGTRGRGIPLTGFAIRLAPHLAEQFDVIYQGAFVASGVTPPARNGEPCLPPLADDSLEAVNLRLLERMAE
jgi:hypothetical protein